MKFIDPTDEALNRAFAIEVAGYTMTDESWFVPGGGALARMVQRGNVMETLPDSEVIPNFVASVDATMPYLAKYGELGIHYMRNNRLPKGGWYIRLWTGEPIRAGNCRTLAKAIVICLLRDKGIVLEFTK